MRTAILTFAHTYGIEGPCSISQVLASANGAVKRYCRCYYKRHIPWGGEDGTGYRGCTGMRGLLFQRLRILYP
jgi:hypothetical protein